MLIHHITLLTGHTATHRLDTIDASAVAACRSLLPEGGPIPAYSPFRAEIHLPIWTIWRGREPIVTCGIGRGFDDTWMALVELQSRFGPVAAANPPVSAWLAVAILPSLAALSRDDVGWLGDFERCMAAAILLRK